MHSPRTPHAVIIAGPNGAGKTSAAPYLLQGELRIETYVNADVIAAGLSGFNPEAAAIQAGRTMIERIEQLARARKDFAFESTLSSLTLRHHIRRLRAAGYVVHLCYLWLPTADLAVERVRLRVENHAGHDVPEPVIRRRFVRSLRNLRGSYLEIVSDWRVYDSSAPGHPRLIARGTGDTAAEIDDPLLWNAIRTGEPEHPR